MRKIITTTFVSIDGVMQAPGGPEEDTTGGFTLGGWMMAYADEKFGRKMNSWMQQPFALLLGRVTYDIFAGFWPTAKHDQDIALPFNANQKYVVTANPAFTAAWEHSTVVSGDVVAEIKKLKAMDGPDLWVHGSGKLIQTLLKNDLIDQMNLWIIPVTLGRGKRLFAEGTKPQGWKLVDSFATTTGVIYGSYEPAGEIQRGRTPE